MSPTKEEILLKFYTRTGPMVYLRITSLRDSVRYRRSEWGLGLITILWGMLLLEPHETLANPNWVYMREWAAEWVWGSSAVLLGFARLLVLYINGRWRRSAHLRMLTAGFCCFFWATLSWGLWLAGTWSPQMAIYIGFIVIDFHTIYEAAKEARQADDKFYGG